MQDDELCRKAKVLRLADIDVSNLEDLLHSFGLRLHVVALNEEIPGSYWDDCEAGLIQNRLYLRPDTPVHSALHEACHFICMDDARKQALHTDAGGDFEEENAVNYLEILLGTALGEVGFERITADMDTWGYTFRLGSARAWFEQDAEDARAWLESRGLLAALDEFVASEVSRAGIRS
jgi:hypothetical protein